MATKHKEIDEIGPWSEIKLDILKDYAGAYSKILSTRESPSFRHVYIDAFAGSGLHKSRKTGDFVPGSPMNALNVKPPFCEYYFIDLDDKRVQSLESLSQKRQDVHVYHGDCNDVLLTKVFPRVRYQDYRRGLCILDPYGLHLNWSVLEEAGHMRSLDIFLNFPIADINRNVLWRDRAQVPPEQVKRLNAFWGDNSWSEVAYTPSRQGNLFGDPSEEKATNSALAEGFRRRLKTVAGFSNVPRPLEMRNSHNAIVYYLYFASQQRVAENVVRDIFRRHRGDF